MKHIMFIIIGIIVLLSACTLDEVDTGDTNGNTGGGTSGETGLVTRVIDGDTIDVNLNGDTVRVRYVGVNTPERDEPCYADATAANEALVLGQSVRLEIDQSDTDRFDRLLRYVYVGDTFVNESLVSQGFAEAVLYNPDDREFDNFRQLEQNAARQGLGCHDTGIFDDNTDTR